MRDSFSTQRVFNLLTIRYANHTAFHTKLWNHRQNNVAWLPHINVITGPNGAGKTSLIDAIHYLCMSRSFVSRSDQYVVHQGESYFMLKGEFKGNIRAEFEVGCSYSRGEGKKIFVNDGPLDRLSDLIGMVLLLYFHQMIKS